MRIPVISDLIDKFRDEVSVAITQQGIRKADKFSIDGPKFMILSELRNEGEMTIKELSKSTGMSTFKVREVCKALLKSGDIRKVSK